MCLFLKKNLDFLQLPLERLDAGPEVRPLLLHLAAALLQEFYLRVIFLKKNLMAVMGKRRACLYLPHLRAQLLVRRCQE